MSDESLHQNEQRSGAARHTPWLEWCASGAGLLLTLCIFGFITWQAFDDAVSPPAITVEATNISSIDGGYRVMFQARNAGGAAAAQVRIEGALSSGSHAPETSSVVLDYIPGQSAREGGLFFTQDPRSGNLALRVSGFARP
ncbi:uncharacterized protein (TIGR02588 family) [Microvirga lupini]|uniref:Uncharacterized protein (TIGR02588 family) n=1 Tax=Microvirga lupini TaxID=420324 RepID=A0A7W4VM18_9HYPH|nr:TIGR02588 family protein [Microvirga lupini]MBB3019679.1 uncharacterized protein (TIGR02588 family) [Microvirga lupini]